MMIRKIIPGFILLISTSVFAQSVEITINKDENDEKPTQQRKKNPKKVNSPGFHISYGAAIIPKGSSEDLNKHLGFSNIFDFGGIYSYQPNVRSPFVFMAGLNFNIKALRFSDNRFIVRDVNNGEISLEQNADDLTKSKLRATYITVPIGVKYSFAKKQFSSENEPYRNVNKGLAVSLQVFGGFRIANSSVVKGKNVKYRDKKTNFGLNDLNYGGQLTLSLNKIGVFFRQEINPYFKDGYFDNRRVFMVGFELGI